MHGKREVEFYRTLAPATPPGFLPHCHDSHRDDATGDGSFSSPGLYGFYPWIDASKRYYGIVAREDTNPAGLSGPAATSNYWQSVLCGQAIRKGFLTGEQQ